MEVPHLNLSQSRETELLEFGGILFMVQIECLLPLGHIAVHQHLLLNICLLGDLNLALHVSHLLACIPHKINLVLHLDIHGIAGLQGVVVFLLVHFLRKAPFKAFTNSVEI